MIKFDFQLFAEPLDIPGIDEDILKELAEETDSLESAAEDVAEPASEAEPKAEPIADADSVNKQVEVADEFEDVKEGQTIPYDRFKSVNDRRKNAESRIRELEEQLKAAQSSKPVEPAAQVQQGREDREELIDTNSFTDEQEKRIYEIAAQRVKEKRKLTDEDIEALEYSDDPTAKVRYQKALSNEVNSVVRELQQYATEQKRNDSMVTECSQEFDNLSKQFAGYADAQDRWKYISQDRFSQLPQRRQAALNDAFNRLQAKKGTYTDLEIVSDYFALANDEWETARAHGTKPKPKSNKLYEAQKLPKSPGIVGGSGTDVTLTTERIAEILNTPGAWESLSQKEQEAILSGKI